MKLLRALRYNAELGFYRLSTTRRWLMTLIASLVPLLLAWLVVVIFSIQPQQVENDLRLAEESLANLVLTLNTVNSELGNSQRRQLQSQAQQLTEQVQLTNRTVTELSDAVIRQQDILPLLQELLARESSLQIRSLDKSPAIAMISTDQALQLYQHPLELTVAGDYFVILQWLTSIEKFGNKVFWQTMDVEQDGQTSVVTIRLHTLSRTKEWIDV